MGVEGGGGGWFPDADERGHSPPLWAWREGRKCVAWSRGGEKLAPTFCPPGVSSTAAVTAATCQEVLGGVGGEPTSWYRAGQKRALVNLESDLQISGYLKVCVYCVAFIHAHFLSTHLLSCHDAFSTVLGAQGAADGKATP